MITGGGGSDVRGEGFHIRGGDLKLEVGTPRDSSNLTPGLFSSYNLIQSNPVFIVKYRRRDNKEIFFQRDKV